MRTILIVEDNESCAETLQIAFESMPETNTIVLRSPDAALVALREGGNDIAALVTDLHTRVTVSSSFACFAPKAAMRICRCF